MARGEPNDDNDVVWPFMRRAKARVFREAEMKSINRVSARRPFSAIASI